MGLAQFPVVVIGLAALLAWPLGIWMYRAMEVPEGTFLARAWDPVARLLGRDAVTAGQDWKQYSIALLVFNAVMFAFGWAVLAFQHVLPLNPDARGPIDADLIFNTVSSFVTNTNLQHYSGRSRSATSRSSSISRGSSSCRPRSDWRRSRLSLADSPGGAISATFSAISSAACCSSSSRSRSSSASRSSSPACR